MDITTATTTVTTTIGGVGGGGGGGVGGGGGGGLSILLPPTKSPEAENETPPRIQPTKPISFTNGVLKRHAHNHHAPPNGVTYKECLKNHAASLGGHALDGCGEFMPAPTATASDPTSLKCAACGCHRNFHRREPEDLQAPTTHVIEYHPHHRHHPLPPPPAVGARELSPGSQSPPPISSSYYPGSAPHMLLALSGGENNNHHHNHHNNHHTHHHNHHQQPNLSRKRFRTKFSQEQKDKMYEFAEKVGWKMQKSNEETVNGFCNEIGVERGVFKVWMHNNKNTFGKKSANYSSVNPTAIDNQIGNNGNGNNSHSSSINHNHNQIGNGKSNESNNAITNGSSSSS